MKKAENQWTEHDVSGVLMNPVYAITLHPDLFGEHQEYVVSKDQWVEANARLIHTMGPEGYLRRLLAVLEGDFPRQPDETAPQADHD
jgi:hypothetical protein